MKVTVLSVGRPRGHVGAAVAEYEARIARYFNFATAEVREETGRGAAAPRIMQAEGERLLARVPDGTESVALHREGESWSSGRFARYLAELGLHGSPGVTFVIGGAFGLSEDVLGQARHRLSLSACTLPHDLARLVLVEQLYRAGTINRGEPYHKGPAA